MQRNAPQETSTAAAPSYKSFIWQKVTHTYSPKKPSLIRDCWLQLHYWLGEIVFYSCVNEARALLARRI